MNARKQRYLGAILEAAYNTRNPTSLSLRSVWTWPNNLIVLSLDFSTYKFETVIVKYLTQQMAVKNNHHDDDDDDDDDDKC